MKILNFGSLNFDKIYDLPHFVQHGETLLATDCTESLGGKGLNQSIALARAGAHVYHMGCVGSDGALLLDCLQREAVDVSFIQNITTVSGHAIIQRVQGENCIIVYGGANQAASQKYISNTIDMFEKGDLLLLQNEVSNADFAIQYAKEKGLLVAFNVSPITESITNYPLSLVDYFIVNEVEAAALAHCRSDDVQTLLSHLQMQYPQAAIILTLGEQGVLYQHGAAHEKHDIYKVDVLDTTAAGDTFCGYFIAGISKGLEVKENLRCASLASAIAVSRKGAACSIPTLHEVEHFKQKRKEVTK